MEDKDMQEVYNPQSGENIKIQKKQFWKEWRFWLYSVIAVLLMLISISSMATACAAINAGVGREDESSSFVARGKQEAYHRDEYEYGDETGFIYNYSSTLYVMDGHLDTYEVVSGESVDLDPNIQFRLKAFTSAYNGTYEVWKNGYLWQRVNLTGDSWSSVFAFDFSTGYIWIFDYNPTDQAFADGMANGHYFNSLGVKNADLVIFSYLATADPVQDTTGDRERLVYYDIFSFVVDETDWYVCACARNWFYSEPHYWEVMVYYTTSSVPVPLTEVRANRLGVWLIYPPDDFFGQTSAVACSYYKVVSFEGAVITKVSNAGAFNRLIAFDGSKTSTDFYNEGYANGYGNGFGEGKAVGFTEGANSVSPDSLTTTLVAVFQQPFNQIYRFFNFNILGLNILGLASALISVFVIIKVVKKIL